MWGQQNSGIQYRRHRNMFGQLHQIAGGGWTADIFGDGSNMLTSNFSNSSLSTVEGNGSGFTVHTGTVAYDSNVPKPGFVKSLTMSQNVAGQRIDYSMQTGDYSSGVKAYSFWVYTERHDDDDNLVFTVNLRRQNVGSMHINAYETDRSATTNDSFSLIAVDTWTHMCVVDEGSTMRTYKNGSSIGTHAIDNKMILDPDYPRLYYLSDADARNEVFITGARMFNRSLSQSEVTTLYNEEPAYGS